MAVLEKIRKRSVLLFIIIIGALLAFILGDFLNSGRNLFGPGDTVAQVGDVKVKQMTFSKRSEQLENVVKRYRESGQNLPAQYSDPDYRYSEALNQTLLEALMAVELDRLGIEVTDQFISQYVSNPGASAEVMNLLINELGGDQQVMAYLQQNGIVDPVSYLDAVKNPARYRLDDQTAAALTGAWKNMEENLAQQKQYILYQQMLNSMMQPNKADAKAAFENQNNLAQVQAVSVPLNTVPDTEIEVTDADIAEVYNLTKGASKLNEENREIAFIVVPIISSVQDYIAGDTETQALVAELKTSEGVKALDKHKGFKLETVKVTEDAFSSNPRYAMLRADSTGVKVGTVSRLNAPADTRLVAKILDINSGIDKVVYDFLPVDSQEVADSIFGGKTYAQVDSIIGAQTGGQFVDMTASLINPDAQSYAGGFASVEAIADALENSPLNEYVFVSGNYQGQPISGVVMVKERDAKVPAYEIAEMSYKIYPSTKTRQELSQQLHSYVANHPTAERFVNDSTMTYNIRYNVVSDNSYTLGDSQTTPGTRSIIKWVMDADKGDVSPVFTRQKTITGRNGQADESQEYLVAVAVTDIYKDYVPASSQLMKDGLTNQARDNKKAKVIIDKYQGKGKNIAEYAKAMGATPQTMNVAFGAGTIGGDAQGAVAAAKKGDVVGPVQGYGAVYVFQVEDVNAPEFDESDIKARLEEVSNNFRRPQAGLPILVGKRKIQNNTLRFTADPISQ